MMILGKNKDGNTKCMMWKFFNRNNCSWLNTWLDVVLGGVDVIRNFLWFSGFFYGLGEIDKMEMYLAQVQVVVVIFSAATWTKEHFATVLPPRVLF